MQLPSLVASLSHSPQDSSLLPSFDRMFPVARSPDRDRVADRSPLLSFLCYKELMTKQRHGSVPFSSACVCESTLSGYGSDRRGARWEAMEEIADLRRLALEFLLRSISPPLTAAGVTGRMDGFSGETSRFFLFLREMPD